MYTHPAIAYELIKERHRDLIADAERHRAVRSQRSQGPHRLPRCLTRVLTRRVRPNGPGR